MNIKYHLLICGIKFKEYNNFDFFLYYINLLNLLFVYGMTLYNLVTIDKKEIAPVNSTVEQKTTHSGEGGVAKEKEDGNGNEKPSLEPVTSSKFQVGAIVRVTSFNWNGIYVGHIGRVNDDAATYQVSFEDNTVDEAVEEENILEYVEK